MFMILFFIVEVLLLFVGILLSVAFFTLFERKILGLSQNRMGPNKVFFFGIFQPFLDGMKLLTKEFFFPIFSNVFSMMWGPLFYFIMMVLVWFNLNHYYIFMSHKMSLFFLVIMLGSSIYTALLTGIGSQSKFAYIGSIRVSSQAISYEICLSIFLFSLLIFSKSFSISTFSFFCFFNFLIWFLFILSETNRAPFDFAEGESELISGFNIEMGSVGFVLLFLGEYGMILVFSFIGSFFIMPMPVIMTFFFSFLIVLSRSTLPRFRYDFLMGFCWFFLLPLTILLLFIFIFF